MKIKIFSMGGTIDKLYFDDLSRYEVGDPQVAGVLKEAKVHFDYEIEDVVRKDSLRLMEADRELLRQRIAASPHRLALVTHGTDTMVETGHALKGIPEKVIVLTGALSAYRFRQSDATFNIGCAIGALQVLRPRGLHRHERPGLRDQPRPQEPRGPPLRGDPLTGMLPRSITCGIA